MMFQTRLNRIASVDDENVTTRQIDDCIYNSKITLLHDRREYIIAPRNIPLRHNLRGDIQHSRDFPVDPSLLGQSWNVNI